MTARTPSVSSHPLLSTADLLAEAHRFHSGLAWARELGITAATMSNARKIGHLRPSHVAAVALKLELEVEWWVALSAVERDRETLCKRQVLHHLHSRALRQPQRGRQSPSRRAASRASQCAAPLASLQLLDAAAKIQSLTDWGTGLGLHPKTLYVPRQRGRLSITLAAELAWQLGFDQIIWATVAALESGGATLQRMENALFRAGIMGPYPVSRGAEIADALGDQAAAVLADLIELEPRSAVRDRVVARLRPHAQAAVVNARPRRVPHAPCCTMPKSLDLLTIATQAIHVPAWSASMGLSRETIDQAMRRGRLSASLAGGLAAAAGEDVLEWVLVAAVEGESDPALQQRMLAAMCQQTATRAQ